MSLLLEIVSGGGGVCLRGCTMQLEEPSWWDGGVLLLLPEPLPCSVCHHASGSSLPRLPACTQPMKCLCASKNCRGVIGGAQDREGGAAARAALQAAAVEMAADDPDPDYIMVTGALWAVCVGAVYICTVPLYTVNSQMRGGQSHM